MPELTLLETGQNIHIIRPYASTVGGEMPTNIFHCKDVAGKKEYTEGVKSVKLTITNPVKATKLTTDDYLVKTFINDDDAEQHYIYYRISHINGSRVSYYDHIGGRTVVLKRQGIAALKNRFYLKDTARDNEIKYWASENEVMGMLVQWYEDLEQITKESELLLDNVLIQVVEKGKLENGFLDLTIDEYSKCLDVDGITLDRKWADDDIRCYSFSGRTKNDIETKAYNEIRIILKHDTVKNKMAFYSDIMYVFKRNIVSHTDLSTLFHREWSSSLYEIEWQFGVMRTSHNMENCINPEECNECISYS
jgi:hypothetical protein